MSKKSKPKTRTVRSWQYREADTSTLKGLKRAEWYKAHGWTIYSTGLFIVRFQKCTTREVVINDNNN